MTLYTTNCPKCKILESKLKAKNIEYNTVTDIEVMQKKGFNQAPMLEIGNMVLGFQSAVNYLNGVK